jgi:hypothetical protein
MSSAPREAVRRGALPNTGPWPKADRFGRTLSPGGRPVIRTGACLAILLGCAILPIGAAAQSADEGRLPFRQPPVDYFGPATEDPVARLAARLESGEARLEFREGTGYLPALLEALDVPVSSQMLVFAKNSVNARLISPENPRALYFNDEIYVGWVPGAPALEISAVDPHKGGIFYTLRQTADRPAKLVREESCLLCHASASALSVPGHLARSFLTDPRGTPIEGQSRINHDTPYAGRWGGWYVTGDFGTLAHQGNLASAAALGAYRRDPAAPGQTAQLERRLEVTKYPAPHSDLVALLVHDHQLHLHNLLARMNFEERLERRSAPARLAADDEATPGLTATEERFVRYLLFVDAPPLPNPVRGRSAFETEFAKQGPRDREGRSLRQFDLETRLFRFRCSYLIYSRAFDALPAPTRSRVLHRLGTVLRRSVAPAPYDRLPASERAAIFGILRQTKENLPEDWGTR